ncbi:MAG: 3-isopropylmalate dehydratase small subunit, partial [Pyrinomonadaceae bacterium]
LPVVLADAEVAEIVRRAGRETNYRLTVDLERRVVEDGTGFTASFEIDEFRRLCLLEGLDDIGLTLRHEAEISAYESRRAAWRGPARRAAEG